MLLKKILYKVWTFRDINTQKWLTYQKYVDKSLFFRIRANKVILAYSSELLRPILSSNCDCAGSFIPITYDILLPDFNPEPVQKIIDLIYYGSTSISQENQLLILEMDSICKTLQIKSLPNFENLISSSTTTIHSQLPAFSPEKVCFLV